MKINEILESNKVIIVLKELDTEFNNVYPRIVKLAKSLYNNKQVLDVTTMSNMVSYLDGFIKKFDYQSDQFLNTQFNTSDKQIKRMKNKIIKMKHNIDYLRKML